MTSPAKFVACLLAVTAAGVSLNGYAGGPIITGGNLSAEAKRVVELIKPQAAFDAQKLPPAPDYSSPGAWAALPGRKDEADIAPPNTKYPEAQDKADADVFFIYPTIMGSSAQDWNIPIDDPAAVKEAGNIMAYCASAFNAAARVHAPRYRNAALYAFFDDKTDSGIKAVNIAYGDVERAFLHYIKFYNNGRPFILAGHSQGTIHGLRLLQEKIIGTPLARRLVAAYLIGGSIPRDLTGIRPSQSADDTGVMIGWNTYTSQGDPSIFTNGLITWINGSYDKMGGRPLLETNPLSWKLNGPEEPASENPGSIPFITESEKTPSLIPAVCGADASGRVLIIDKPETPGFFLSEAQDLPVLNAKYGDYHSFDYTLFYESLRRNAVDRVRTFVSAFK